MKILITALAALSLIATSAQAQHRDDRWGVDSNRNSPYYGRYAGDNNQYYERRSKKNNNDAIVAGVAGLIIGGMIVNSARKHEEQYPPTTQYYPPVTQSTLVCENYYVQDMNGNYALDSNFRAIVRQRCWSAR
jgi:hypothetical protein